VKGLQQICGIFELACAHKADDEQGRVLCIRRKRSCDCTLNQRDEFALPLCLTQAQDRAVNGLTLSRQQWLRHWQGWMAGRRRTWVKVRHGGESAPLPLFPSKQTFANAIGMSVEGQERPSALQKKPRRFWRRWSNVQLVEQGLGLFQIERVEAFGEPVVDRSQHGITLAAPSLFAQEHR
jgi:hypothetical protein